MIQQPLASEFFTRAPFLHPWFRPSWLSVVGLWISGGSFGDTAHMTTNTILAVLCLLVTFTVSVAALLFACFGRPRHSMWAALLATITLIISIMGLTTWTPFGFFPEVGFTNGEISLRSKWLFFVPLTVGSAAFVVAVMKGKSWSEDSESMPPTQVAPNKPTRSNSP